MIIDSHQHFWQLSKPFDYSWLNNQKLSKINRDFLPGDLKPHLKESGVDHSIFVQTQHNVDETSWVLQLADENEFIAGVVGWVDLASEQCEEQLLAHLEHPKFVGIRHITQDEPDDNFIVRPEIIRGLKVLEKHRVPFDLLFYVKHLKHAATLARELPNLPMVINHLSKPQIKDQITAGWIDDLKAAASYPNIYCKLSGMVTEADWEFWKPADLKTFVDAALESFGPDRCMYGSDWPVCELAATYSAVLDACQQNLASLSSSEKDLVFYKTAMQFYQLEF